MYSERLLGLIFIIIDISLLKIIHFLSNEILLYIIASYL
jgi:hypothetical protein